MKKLIYIILFTIPYIVIAQNPVRDSTFSFDGHVATAVGPNNEDASSVVVQADGKIIAGGTQTDHPIFGPQHFALVRYLTDGNLDSAFGVNGKVISSFLSQNFCNVIKLQTDEKILAAGQAGTGVCIARYLTDGSIDSSYGINGFTSVLSATSATIGDIEILQNGKVLGAGTRSIPGSNFEALLVRFNNDGSPDSTFGVNGFVYPATTGFTSVSVGNILVQSDGKIILGGSAKFDPGTGIIDQMFLLRVDSSGNIDSTFAVNGIATYPTALNINDMAFDLNSNIVAIGEIGTNPQGTAGDVVVMRFLSDGSQDLSFGTSGSTRVSADSYADYANAILIQPDNKILLGGSYFNFSGGSGTDCIIIRFGSDGLVDSTFGLNGIFRTGVSSGTDRIMDMAMTPDNKIVVSGNGNYSNIDFIVGRIITDIVLAADDISEANDLILYPNPALDYILIENNNQSHQILYLEIFDTRGKLVSTYNEKLTTNKSVQIDISRLNEGIYYTQLINNNAIVSTKKIAVLH